MATLQATKSNGELIAVQANDAGQLVAKGLEGPRGLSGSCNQGTVYVSYSKPVADAGNEGDWWMQLDYEDQPE
tara:strand:+ start:729 stop:947 length:219 start_codon:yes stop_codon:yes gene_type:complete